MSLGRVMQWLYIKKMPFRIKQNYFEVTNNATAMYKNEFLYKIKVVLQVNIN